MNSSILSTDLNPVDGINDYFRLLGPNPSDPDTYGPYLPAKKSGELVTFYTVAFLKVHLQGDNRYKRFLTPGYATSRGLPVDLTAISAPHSDADDQDNCDDQVCGDDNID